MISQNTRPKILLAALLASVITIPLSNQLNSIATIVFVAACVIQQPWKQSRATLVSNRYWLIPVLYFIWTALTYFWDSSGAFTIKELERYTIFLFLPPAMAMIPRISGRHIRLACHAFVAVTVVVSLICLAKAYQEYLATGDYRVFYYQYLGEQMQLNAIFLSNYCLASITWLLYYAYVEKGNHTVVHRAVVITATLFLLFMIFLLSSKLIIFLTLLIVLIFVLLLGYVRGHFFRAALITSLLIVAGYVAVTQLSYLSWRIRTTELKKYEGPQDNHNGIAIRLFMWETAAELIKERPLTGYGLRGGRVELLEAYRKKNFELGLAANYHSHNQYLESSLMAGLPATVILILMIAFALVKGVRHKNFLLILMVCHFMIQSVFESTFEVQHELVFYIFFLFLFYYHAPVLGEKIKLNPQDGNHIMF